MRSAVSILALASLSQWALAQSQYRLECLLLGGLGEVAAEQGILGPAATQFCSSFITDAATQTVFYTATGTSVVTSTVPATVTVSNPSCVPTALAARAVTDNSGLSDFVKEAISLACTCLHLAPTVTTTRTLGLAASTTVVTAPVATTTVCVGRPVPRFNQCGGQGYTGPTQCVAGSVCTVVNASYSQCV